MRIAVAVFVVSIAALPATMLVDGIVSRPGSAQAQNANSPVRVAEVAKKAVAKRKAEPPAKKGPQAPPSGYGTMALAERTLIQFDLAWLGYYNGLINGDFNDKSVAAVKAFQKDRRFKETGVLAPPERAALAASSKAKQDQVDWRMVEDKVTGAQVGLPLKQVPNAMPSRTGTRWSSAQGQVQVETFRIREPGTKLANVYEQQKKEPPNRKLEVNVLRDDVFILSGTQGLKKFYVRAAVKDFEVRGVTILWDQATEGIMDPVVVVMSSAFAPFPGMGLTALAGPPPRRKVDYGTGIVVSPGGHILTDHQLTDGCGVIEVSGYGDANVVDDDEASGLSLLRVFGATDLVPAAIVHEGARAGDLTLVGIADPQTQGGARVVTTASAKLNGDGLVPAPQLGFAGAAALDTQGRFFGMVALKSPVIASNGPVALPQAKVITVEAIRQFLDARYVNPSTGRAGADAAKAALVRVICVRK